MGYKNSIKSWVILLAVLFLVIGLSDIKVYRETKGYLSTTDQAVGR